MTYMTLCACVNGPMELKSWDALRGSAFVQAWELRRSSARWLRPSGPAHVDMAQNDSKCDLFCVSIGILQLHIWAMAKCLAKISSFLINRWYDWCPKCPNPLHTNHMLMVSRFFKSNIWYYIYICVCHNMAWHTWYTSIIDDVLYFCKSTSIFHIGTTGMTVEPARKEWRSGRAPRS